MKFSFFYIPVRGSQQAERELNIFLAGNRIVNVEKQCIQNGENSYWTFCVEWLEHEGPLVTNEKPRRKVDYRELLNDRDFAVYVKLRDLRREMAQQAGVPPYVIFTNEQLADIVRHRITTKNGLFKLKGVGHSRVEKYGGAFLALMEKQRMGKTEDEKSQD